MATPQVLQNPDPGVAFQTLYDALGRAYWDASDVPSKDLIHGAQEAVGEIITAIDKQQLADNTAIYAQLASTIKTTNKVLEKIQADIDKITKNIKTAATVLSAISTVLSLFPL